MTVEQLKINEVKKDIKEEINLKSLFFYTSLTVFIISFIFILFGDSINSIAFKGKFDYFRTFKVDLMIILIGALQFINGLFHWFILGLGTKKNIIDYLKIIIYLNLSSQNRTLSSVFSIKSLQNIPYLSKTDEKFLKSSPISFFILSKDVLTLFLIVSVFIPNC